MNGKFTIDGTESSTWGIIIMEGSYEGVVQFPPLKKVPENNWQEYDGIDVELSNPVLDIKEFEMTFVTVEKFANIGGLLDALSDGASHDIYFYDLDITKTIRLSNASKLKGTFLHMRQITLTFCEDQTGLVDTEPVSDCSQTGYEIDNVQLSDYGIYILEGSDEEILIQPEVKKNLIVSIENKAGAEYPDDEVKYEAKDVTINALMIAATIHQFTNNMNALLYALTRPNTRSFYFGATDDTYQCFYKKQAIKKFTTTKGNGIWCEFTLTLCFTDYRQTNETYVLATNDRNKIKTNNNRNLIKL